MRHLPPTSVPLATHGAEVPPDVFDLDAYLDALAPYLIECFNRRIAGRTLYDFLTTEQSRPIPVTLRAFLDGLTRFRAKVRTLDPIQRELLDGRVARLYPRSGQPSPDFTPIVLPPPDQSHDDDPGEADNRV